VTDLVASERAISFGPFRLVPTQRLLLEDDNPVRVGSRALAANRSRQGRSTSIPALKERLVVIFLASEE
jgi:hypothetical protein